MANETVTPHIIDTVPWTMYLLRLVKNPEPWQDEHPWRGIDGECIQDVPAADPRGTGVIVYRSFDVAAYRKLRKLFDEKAKVELLDFIRWLHEVRGVAWNVAEEAAGDLSAAMYETFDQPWVKCVHALKEFSSPLSRVLLLYSEFLLEDTTAPRERRAWAYEQLMHLAAAERAHPFYIPVWERWKHEGWLLTAGYDGLNHEDDPDLRPRCFSSYEDRAPVFPGDAPATYTAPYRSEHILDMLLRELDRGTTLIHPWSKALARIAIKAGMTPPDLTGLFTIDHPAIERALHHSELILPSKGWTAPFAAMLADVKRPVDINIPAALISDELKVLEVETRKATVRELAYAGRRGNLIPKVQRALWEEIQAALWRVTDNEKPTGWDLLWHTTRATERAIQMMPSLRGVRRAKLLTRISLIQLALGQQIRWPIALHSLTLDDLVRIDCEVDGLDYSQVIWKPSDSGATRLGRLSDFSTDEMVRWLLLPAEWTVHRKAS